MAYVPLAVPKHKNAETQNQTVLATAMRMVQLM